MSVPLQQISAYGIARREDSVLMVQIGQSEHGDVVGGEPRGEIAGPMRTPTWHPLSTLDSLPTLEAFRPVIAGSTTAEAESNVDDTTPKPLLQSG